MDTIQASCTLKDVNSFLGVFPPDMLPRSITRPSTVIVNSTLTPMAYPLIFRISRHTWVAIVLDYNTIELEGPLSMVCGEYCSLFALYIDRSYTGKQFVCLFTPDIAHQQVEQFLASEFGSLRWVPRGGLCCTHRYKRWVPLLVILFTTRTLSRMEAVAVIDL
jgi:hypothetical protein